MPEPDVQPPAGRRLDQSASPGWRPALVISGGAARRVVLSRYRRWAERPNSRVRRSAARNPIHLTVGTLTPVRFPLTSRGRCRPRMSGRADKDHPLRGCREIALSAADRTDDARAAFVRQELGSLAESDETTQLGWETLRCYLNQGNAAAAHRETSCAALTRSAIASGRPRSGSGVNPAAARSRRTGVGDRPVCWASRRAGTDKTPCLFCRRH